MPLGWPLVRDRSFFFSKRNKSAFLRGAVNIVDQPARLTRRMQSSTEELANTVSHGIGLIAAVMAAPVLLFAASARGDSRFFVGSVIFTITMVGVYLGSTLYHAWPPTPRKSLLQLVDHSAIFLLIAGTYTPFALGPLAGAYGSALLALVWAIALFGIVVKIARGTARHPKLGHVALPWAGLVRTHRNSAVVSRGADAGIGLADCRRRRLYNRRSIFCERTAPIWPLCLAPVRNGWDRLSFSGPARLHSVTRCPRRGTDAICEVKRMAAGGIRLSSENVLLNIY